MRYLFFLIILIGCTKTAQDNPQYEVDVKPILQFKCFKCHGTTWLDKDIFNKNINKIRYMVIETKRMPPEQLSTYEYYTIKNYIDNQLKD